MAIVLGIIVGVLVGFVLQGNYEQGPINALLGLAGAIIGDAIYYVASGNTTLLFTWGGAVSQFLGAAIFVGIFSLVRKAMAKAIDS